MQDGVIEQRRVLRYHANGFPQTLYSHMADILSVDENPPLLVIVETDEKTEDGRLPTATRPDYGNLISSRYSQSEILHNGPVRTVAKSNIFEFQLSSSQLQGLCAWHILDCEVDFL